MNDWIEVPRKHKMSAPPVPPGAVIAAVSKGPRDSYILTLKLGQDVAEKLGWGDGQKLRILWSAKAPKMKIEPAPAGHPHVYALRGNKKKAAFTLKTAALPEPFARTPQPRAMVGIEIISANERGGSRASILIASLPRDYYGKAAP